MDFFNPHDEDEPEPFKTPATKKSRPAASSVSKKATAKKRVLSDDSDGDFDPLETPAAKTPAAKKLNIGKKPAAKEPRAAAEPFKYEVVNGPDGQALHSEAYMNKAPRRGTSGITGVTSRSARDGTQFWIPNPYNPDTQRTELLRSLKEPKTDDGLERAGHSLDGWYDQKFADTNNKYWLDKKNFCINESGQKVRVVKQETSCDYFGVSYNQRDTNFCYYFLGILYYSTSEIEAAKAYDKLVLASGRKDYHLNFVWALKK